MTPHGGVISAERSAPGASGGISPADLAELIAAFNEVTGRLERTHETLRSEVSRLNAELGRANEEVERSRRLAALGEMAAGIAHEVRNPLGSISLYARMLEDDLADRQGERELARRISSAVRGLDEIVRDVLSFARDIRASAREVDAGELLRESLEACHAEVPAGVRVMVEAGVPRVRCDADLTRRALVNLVRNALEAMAGGGPAGELTVRTARPDGGGAALEVEDSGPGISAEVRARMFNPFFTTRKSGTGLGLAIVHRIAEAHGGRVEVVSPCRDGRGTLVRLVLPEREADGPGSVEIVVPPRTRRERAA